MSAPLGVGFLGAGPVTQAIHLPVLSTLGDRLQVRHIMDVDGSVASEVAKRAGARATTDAHAVLDDPAIDIVAVCSPPQFHAEQVVAACRAGKRAILCEKPLATSAEEAHQIAEVARATNVPIVVGTMHAYDPAYVAAAQEWVRHCGQARLIRSVIYLPPNGDMVALATDLIATPAPPGSPGDLSSREARVARMRATVLGLAIHNIPLVRQFVGSDLEVTAARVMLPFGYLVTLAAADRAAQFIGYMPGAWQPEWILQVWSSDAELLVTFPPSYVLAGSATAELSVDGVRSVWHDDENGYQAEWRHIADIVEGRAQPSISLDDVVDDLLFAVQIADGAARLIMEEG
jgi:myo-inositol 2-dehydrogenase/D-chiro-inositol 1-dehydrogenase